MAIFNAFPYTASRYVSVLFGTFVDRIIHSKSSILHS